MTNTYDLKTTFMCNNNCIHCVVKPYYTYKNLSKIHLSYLDIIENINNITDNIKSIVLTGGEVTIRNDFLRIINYIENKYPNKNISIQTNARKLNNYIEVLSNYKNISYVIAVHSHDEKVHNFITNSKDKSGNPFQETLKSLKEITKYPHMLKNTRLEIVLTKYNMKDIAKTVEFFYNLGFKRIGISYPHLDGYEYNNPQYIKDISFPINELYEPFELLIDFLKTTVDFQLFLESIPMCVFRDKNEKTIQFPNNVELIIFQSNENDVIINTPDNSLKDFHYDDNFLKSQKCSECIFNNDCIGVWSDAIHIWGEEMLLPIKGSD